MNQDPGEDNGAGGNSKKLGSIDTNPIQRDTPAAIRGNTRSIGSGVRGKSSFVRESSSGGNVSTGHGRGSGSSGQVTSLAGKGTTPSGTGTVPAGKVSTPALRGTGSAGRRSSPVGRGTNPAGVGGSSMGRGGNPASKGTGQAARGRVLPGRGGSGSVARPKTTATSPSGVRLSSARISPKRTRRSPNKSPRKSTSESPRKSVDKSTRRLRSQSRKSADSHEPLTAGVAQSAGSIMGVVKLQDVVANVGTVHGVEPTIVTKKIEARRTEVTEQVEISETDASPEPCNEEEEDIITSSETSGQRSVVTDMDTTNELVPMPAESAAVQQFECNDPRTVRSSINLQILNTGEPSGTTRDQSRGTTQGGDSSSHEHNFDFECYGTDLPKLASPDDVIPDDPLSKTSEEATHIPQSSDRDSRKSRKSDRRGPFYDVVVDGVDISLPSGSVLDAQQSTKKSAAPTEDSEAKTNNQKQSDGQKQSHSQMLSVHSTKSDQPADKVCVLSESELKEEVYFSISSDEPMPGPSSRADTTPSVETDISTEKSVPVSSEKEEPLSHNPVDDAIKHPEPSETLTAAPEMTTVVDAPGPSSPTSEYPDRVKKQAKRNLPPKSLPDAPVKHEEASGHVGSTLITNPDIAGPSGSQKTTDEKEVEKIETSARIKNIKEYIKAVKESTNITIAHQEKIVIPDHFLPTKQNQNLSYLQLFTSGYVSEKLHIIINIPADDLFSEVHYTTPLRVFDCDGVLLHLKFEHWYSKELGEYGGYVIKPTVTNVVKPNYWVASPYTTVALVFDAYIRNDLECNFFRTYYCHVNYIPDALTTPYKEVAIEIEDKDFKKSLPVYLANRNNTSCLRIHIEGQVRLREHDQERAKKLEKVRLAGGVPIPNPAISKDEAKTTVSANSTEQEVNAQAQQSDTAGSTMETSEDAEGEDSEYVTLWEARDKIRAVIAGLNLDVLTASLARDFHLGERDDSELDDDTRIMNEWVYEALQQSATAKEVAVTSSSGDSETECDMKDQEDKSRTGIQMGETLQSSSMESVGAVSSSRKPIGVEQSTLDQPTKAVVTSQPDCVSAVTTESTSLPAMATPEHSSEIDITIEQHCNVEASTAQEESDDVPMDVPETFGTPTPDFSVDVAAFESLSADTSDFAATPEQILSMASGSSTDLVIPKNESSSNVVAMDDVPSDDSTMDC